MGLSDTIYNTVFRRTSTFFLALAVGSFFFERTWDSGSKFLFEKINEGKLYKDLKPEDL